MSISLTHPPILLTKGLECAFSSHLFVRHGVGNLKRRIAKEEELKNTVFQYAGKNVQRADRIYAWGCAVTGALGLKTLLKPERHQSYRAKQLIPMRIDSLLKNEIKAKVVSCGYGFTVFLCQTKDGLSKAFGTGLNKDSQLGFQEYPRRSGRILDFVISPALINLPLLHPGKTKLTHVACGRAHTIIATDTEGVYSLGNNEYGQCGRPIINDEQYRGSQTINKLEINGAVKQVVCGKDHTLFLTEVGEVYSCGIGGEGQTGLGCYDSISEPTLVKGDIKGVKIVHLSGRENTVLAVSEEGKLFGWGNAEHDQLYESDEMHINTPRHLPFTDIGKVVCAAAGGSLCAIVNDRGQVFTWGYGVLGMGPNVDRCSKPQQIPATLFGASHFNPAVKVKSVHSGLFHLAAVNDLGDLFVWGKNRVACLGLGHIMDQYFPYKVQISAEVTQVGCGVDHMVVLSKSFV